MGCTKSIRTNRFAASFSKQVLIHMPWYESNFSFTFSFPNRTNSRMNRFVSNLAFEVNIALTTFGSLKLPCVISTPLVNKVSDTHLFYVLFIFQFFVDKRQSNGGIREQTAQMHS